MAVTAGVSSDMFPESMEIPLQASSEASPGTNGAAFPPRPQGDLLGICPFGKDCWILLEASVNP